MTKDLGRTILDKIICRLFHDHFYHEFNGIRFWKCYECGHSWTQKLNIRKKTK